MLKEIADYIFQFKDDNWHELNSFLRENYPNNDDRIREALVKLIMANRIEVKDNKHLGLGIYKRIQPEDQTNTFTTLDNWPIEARLTLEEREKMNQNNIPKDYKFEILKFLSANNNEVDIRPLINKFISDSNHSSTYFGTLLNTMSKTDKTIWADHNVISLSLGNNSMYQESHPIMARIESNGVSEFARLRQLYDPNSRHLINITQGPNSPIVGGNFTARDMIANEPDQESKEIARKGLKINKQMLIWAIIAGLATVLTLLLALR